MEQELKISSIKLLISNTLAISSKRTQLLLWNLPRHFFPFYLRNAEWSMYRQLWLASTNIQNILHFAIAIHSWRSKTYIVVFRSFWRKPRRGKSSIGSHIPTARVKCCSVHGPDSFFSISPYLFRKQWLKPGQTAICVTPGFCITSMTEKHNQQFKFKAVGSKDGQQASTTLTVKPRPVSYVAPGAAGEGWRWGVQQLRPHLQCPIA